MRSLLAIVFLFALAGCEVQPILGRCEIDSDCDRNTTMRTARCLQTVAPHGPCNGADCRCCPLVLDTMTTDEVRAACTQTMIGGDAMVIVPDVAGDTARDGVTSDALASDAGDVASFDAQDVSTDLGAATCVPANCEPGITFCEVNRCRPVLQIGRPCTDAAQCGTTHCSDGVCCNSGCNTPGYSCNAGPDFVGLCTATMSVDSGVTDTGAMDTGTIE